MSDVVNISYAKKKQAEGIARAKVDGVKFGRPIKTEPSNFNDVFIRWKKGEISVGQAAILCGMAKTTFYDHAKRLSDSIS